MYLEPNSSTRVELFNVVVVAVKVVVVVQLLGVH